MKFLQAFVRYASQSASFIIFGLAVTLTFDLLISESNQFIFAPTCT